MKQDLPLISSGKIAFIQQLLYIHRQLRHVNDKSAGPIRLQYASGKASSLNVDGVIADNVDASLGTYKWTIPKDIKPKK